MKTGIHSITLIFYLNNIMRKVNVNLPSLRYIRSAFNKELKGRDIHFEQIITLEFLSRKLILYIMMCQGQV